MIYNATQPSSFHITNSFLDFQNLNTIDKEMNMKLTKEGVSFPKINRSF